MNILRRVVFLSTVVCLGVFIITGCGGKKTNDLIITGDSAKEFEVNVGDAFTFVLDENPTTGFSWHYRIDNTDLVFLETDEYISPGDKGIVGAGGHHRWIFKAVKPGTAVITFEYYRDWEKDKIEKSYVYTVNVK